MKSIIITRPEPQASDTERWLKTQGYRATKLPMTIMHEASGCKYNLSSIPIHYAGIILTSQTALRLITRYANTRIYTLPFYVTGSQLAQKARIAGFNSVIEAGGNAHSLIELLLQASHLPQPLLYIYGTPCTIDMVKILRSHNKHVDGLLCYQMKPVEHTEFSCNEALHNNDMVMFYSSYAAKLFVQMGVSTGYTKRISQLDALCISSAIQKIVQEVAWKHIVVSNSPKSEDILATLQKQ